MPIARFQMPDGRIARFEVPEGTTPEQAQGLISASLSGQAPDKISESAKNFAKDGAQFLPGVGKAFADAGRGASQIIRSLGPQYAASADAFGLPNQADIDESRRLDKPLMDTTGGFIGNIAGNVAIGLPSMALGGGLPAAMAGGAGLGAVQPTSSDESRVANMAGGAGAGAAGVGLGRMIGAGYQGVKALFEPFTQGGRERIAGRMIQRFADDPASIARTSSAPTMTGARPTIAEQTGDAGLARLQDSLRAADPQFNNQITARLAENNAARVGALRDLAGQDGAKAFAEANRSGTAQQLYKQAFDVPLDKAALSAAEKGQLTTLMRSPDIQAAMKEAQRNLVNRGGNPAKSSGSIEGLHEVKMALDDMIAKAGTETGSKSARASSLQSLQSRLVSFIERMSPEYEGARVTYAQMSKPVNAYDIGEEVFKRATSNTSDLAGNPRMQANALMSMLKDEPALIRRATGRSGNSLAGIMEPEQLNMLRAVASESDRAAAVASAGNGPGSATAQRMAAQNVLRQIIGPTGLPESWAENALANTIVGKPLNLVYGGIAEPRIQQELARAILDPDAARAVLQAARRQGIRIPPNRLQELTAAASRSVAPALSVSGER